MEPAYKLLTVEEFLDCCPNDQRHYQLIDGVIVAMAPPAIPHQIIAGNLTGEIYAAVRANRPGCTTRSQAGIAPQGRLGRNHFETDITVTCEKGGHRGIAAEPLLIVEIQSPSTERDDVFVKLPEYQSIRSLQEILYIESERVAVGKAPASPTPKKNRMVTMEAAFQAVVVRAVKRLHQETMRVKARRGPILSPSQAPGTCSSV